MRQPRRRSDCPISSALDLLGDKWSLLVMRDVLLRSKSHYREFLASEEGIATNILADRLARLEAAGLLERTGEEPRSGKQAYRATAKGQDLIPLLLEMMVWSAAHDPQVAVPEMLIAELARDRAAAARAIRDLGGVEAFLARRANTTPDEPGLTGQGRVDPPQVSKRRRTSS
jgi:DNA-binding HxlR family transcriptional regulator